LNSATMRSIDTTYANGQNFDKLDFYGSAATVDWDIDNAIKFRSRFSRVCPVSDARRSKDLKTENNRLKRWLADDLIGNYDRALALFASILSTVLRPIANPPSTR
jgi:hypothetical protein